MALKQVPNIVNLHLPANYRRAGTVRPAIVTSIANVDAETLNLVVFLEPGDRLLNIGAQETQFIGAAPRTETGQPGGWWSSAIILQ